MSSRAPGSARSRAAPCTSLPGAELVAEVVAVGAEAGAEAEVVVAAAEVEVVVVVEQVAEVEVVEVVAVVAVVAVAAEPGSRGRSRCRIPRSTTCFRHAPR